MSGLLDDIDVPSAKDSLTKAVEGAEKRVQSMDESPLAFAKKEVDTAMKTAFGSPQPDPAKQLDFGVNAAEAETPATPAVHLPVSSTPTGDEVDYNQFIKETLLWTNKIRSSFYFVVGLLLWVVVRSIILSNTTIVTGTCYLLLGSLAFNFLRGVMLPELQKRCTWSHSGWTSFITSTFETGVNAAAAVHDRHLNGLDPLRTLEVGLGLWGLSVLGRALDAVTLLLVLHIAAFALPLAYTTQKAKIDAAVSDAYGKAKTQYDSVDRKIKAAAVLGLLGLLFFLLPSVDRFAAFFVCLAYARAILKPAEDKRASVSGCSKEFGKIPVIVILASVQKRIEPVINTVRKMGTSASTMAVSTLNKYDLTPTPNRKKRV